MSAINRQLRDIQVQGNKLLKGDPTIDDIEDYVRYSDELKNYLLTHVDNELILERVKELPDSNQLTRNPNTPIGVIATILIILSLGMAAAYLKEQIQINYLLNVVREIIGKYGTIEFMMKNAYG